MRALAKQLVLLLSFVLLMYLVLLAISLPFGTDTRSDGPIDSGLAGASMFMTEPKYVFLNRAGLEVDKPRMILFGASNVVVGFKPHEIQPLIPNVEVDNMSIGGANITEVAQSVDLALDQLSPAGRDKATFVIGIWYGMFATNETRWTTPDRHLGDTDLDIERYRYGFYRRSGQGPRALLPEHDLALGVALIRPYLLIDQLSRQSEHWLQRKLGRRDAMRTEAERNALQFSDADKTSAMNYWHTQLQTSGELADQQFEVLDKIVKHVAASGARVVILDLPVPHWHMQRTPYLASYAAHRTRLLADWQGNSSIRYVDMTNANDDADFSDEVHPKPRVTRLWAARAVNAVQEVNTADGNAASGKKIS